MSDTIYLAKKSLQELQNLESSTVSLKDWLSIIALFFSAILAVIIGQYLQNKKSKADRIYNNKFYIFSIILGYRHALGWCEEFVVAINQLPIVFNKNEKVIKKLEKFIEKHKNDSISSEELSASLNDLILEIAKDLKFLELDNVKISSEFFRPDSSLYRYKREEIQNYEYVTEKESKRNENI